MPICKRCGVMLASVEMRRSPKKSETGATEWICDEKLLCKARRKAAREMLRSSQS